MPSSSQDFDESVIKFEGTAHRICLRPRNRKDGDMHIAVEIDCEDDDNWFNKSSFSSFWIDELIQLLQTAKNYMENNHNREKRLRM